MTCKIVFQGQAKDPSGYGVASRGYINSLLEFFSLNNVEVDFKIVPIVADEINSLTESEREVIEKYAFKSDEEIRNFIQNKDYYYIFHHPPAYAAKLKECSFFARNSIKNINVTVWETDALPPLWNTIFKSLDVSQIVVPCSWNKKLFEDSLKGFNNEIPVEVVPHLINDDYGHTEVAEISSTARESIKDEQFNCLTVGQWTDRKALLSVVKAFLMEFADNDDCNLIVKTYGNIQVKDPNYQKQQQNLIAQEIWKNKMGILSDTNLSNGTNNQANVRLLYGVMSQTDMNYLYKNTDVFALFSKAEGFGLPIAEAILHETPVIVHDQGGHTDFVDPDTNFIVGTHKVPAFCTYAPRVYTCDSNWYDTDMISARQKLRECYNLWKESKEELNTRGVKSKDYMLKVTGNAAELGKKLYEFIVME